VCRQPNTGGGGGKQGDLRSDIPIPRIVHQLKLKITELQQNEILNFLGSVEALSV
jgi:hypothetical protein